MDNDTQEEHDILARKSWLTALEKRVAALEVYLPILQEVYAGRIGGVSEEAGSVMDEIGARPADEVQAAIENVDAKQAEADANQQQGAHDGS